MCILWIKIVIPILLISINFKFKPSFHVVESNENCIKLIIKLNASKPIIMHHKRPIMKKKQDCGGFKYFQNKWVAHIPWVELVIGVKGKMHKVCYVICSNVESLSSLSLISCCTMQIGIKSTCC